MTKNPKIVSLLALIALALPLAAGAIVEPDTQREYDDFGDY